MIKCQNCDKNFIPDEKQQEFINSSVKKGMTFVMFECQNCGLGFGFNPSGGSVPSPELAPLRTPISGSHGFISYIDDNSEKFYGCGETGAIWKKLENLFRDIEKIIVKYPHRARFYLKKDGNWIANPTEPENIYELIDSESYTELSFYEQD